MRKTLLCFGFVVFFTALGFADRELEKLNTVAIPPDKERAAKPEDAAAVRRLIEEQTSQLRGLAFKEPVKYKIIERSELRAVLVAKVKEQYSDQELHDYGRTLATLGLVPEGTDLLEAILCLYDEQVAAFYIPEERALYTFKDSAWSSRLDRMILAHELTHALQDQNYDLTKFALKVKDNDDLAQANAALVEGDATLLMVQWYGEHTDHSNMLEDVSAMLKQNITKLRDAPAFLRQTLLFPYQQGEAFASALYQKGGSNALHEAFLRPPTSTQQILHPEKFLENRLEPIAVDLPKSDASSWRLIGNNVLGEFGVRCLLEQHVSAWQAQIIADGWRGDRYHVYERDAKSPTALLWVTHWDSDDSAQEFEDAYKKIQKLRKLPPSITVKTARDGNRVTIWQAADLSIFDRARAH